MKTKCKFGLPERPLYPDNNDTKFNRKLETDNGDIKETTRNSGDSPATFR